MLSIIQRHLRKSARKMSSDSEGNSPQRSPRCTNADNQHLKPPRFPQYSELTEDICRMIISFVADAPCELEVRSGRVTRYHPASMTCVFPYVNKSFWRLADEDENWRAALLRQIAHEERSHVWKSGLRRLLPPNWAVEDDSTLLEEVRKHLQGSMSYKQIYRMVFTHHVKFEAPMFLMPCSVMIGEMYGLHLFEPRYRIMIRNLLEACENPQEARSGGEDIRPGTTVEGMSQPPLLIHFCLPQHLRKGAMAALIQVVRCRIYEQGTADVQLMPIAWVKVEDIWCREDQGNLFYAHATRM